MAGLVAIMIAPGGGDGLDRGPYAAPVRLGDLQTPALVVDAAGLDHNLRTMAEARPGDRLRPHVKAHKCTALAARQQQAGHRRFTCATIREVEGMAAAGLGADLLLANEVVDARRLGRLVEKDVRVTLAVDSEVTVHAAATGGVREVVIDVNVGLPRCGCEPGDAGRLADLAGALGLEVRGVMGYEGHAVGLDERDRRVDETDKSMALLARAHSDVGGELITAGGTGTYDINTVANEIQAGSYALMDTAYARLGLPFVHALTILATVISVNPAGWAVADCGLKALGMDHGKPDIEGGTVMGVSDEHVTFVPDKAVGVGDLVRVLPAHCDPTVALHERLHVLSGDEVLETWKVDLRGW
jgi:D-serine deaminase-like pyridoxal phosphate-dependent protein